MERMFITAALVALATHLAADLAMAQDNKWYGHGSAMYVVPQETEYSITSGELTTSADLETDAGVGLLAALGYGGETGLRGEIELSYRESAIDDTVLGFTFDADVSNLGLMGNIIYAADIGYQWRPYVGAGLGFVRHDVDGGSDDDVLGWQGMAGVVLPLETAEIRFGYRYIATDDFEDGVEQASYGAHNFEVGFSLPF